MIFPPPPSPLHPIPDDIQKMGGWPFGTVRIAWLTPRSLRAVFSTPQRADRYFRSTLARLARWWNRLEPTDRQTYIRVGLLIAVPSLGIPWFGVVIGTGLGAMVGIFRALAGF